MSQRQYICLSRIAIALVGLILTGMSGCESNSSSSSNPPGTASSQSTTEEKGKFSHKQIVADFAKQVVVPTQQSFVQRAAALSTAIDTFAKTPNEETLKATRQAWVNTRAAWEQSESFTFGPAESLGYDGALDTWPLNDTDLQAILKSQDRFTPKYIEELKDTEKGFHAIEYLLFGSNHNKKATEFTPRELAYVQALGVNFAQVAKQLADSWTKGVEGKPAYQEVVATAGESSNSTYPTVNAGAEQMVQGIIDSLIEVADEKMGQPFAKKDQKLFESRFGLNTLKDIKSNVKGAQNVYLGAFPDANTSGASLSAYIAEVNPDLDKRVKSGFQDSLAALEKIPDPIEKNLNNPQATASVKYAQEEITEVREILEKEVLPLIK
ncbi:imelysin family protein [Merismopedia glauca]|uniref:Peptidase M75 n=1 Tax=Merismopedia glauca CCAP 1448/3 TaxID=1296344 RepID=A0A2T1BXL9_9CYAN|nr:imelysin family protein [Merismopedia glauca]PSB00766.1 peptidase M75 [Merismopedia glauca CCAP 1448/3]